MHYVVISGNPKQDGLTQNMADALFRGAKDGGASVSVIGTCVMSCCRCCNGDRGNVHPAGRGLVT